MRRTCDDRFHYEWDAFPFSTQGGKARSSDAPLDASVIDAREIVSIAPRNELTLRVVICMSRAAILCCCNEELWRGVDKTSTRVGQRLAMITIASSPRCISLRRVFALNVNACNIIFYFVWIGTDWVNTEKRWNEIFHYCYYKFFSLLELRRFQLKWSVILLIIYWFSWIYYILW